MLNFLYKNKDKEEENLYKIVKYKHYNSWYFAIMKHHWYGWSYLKTGDGEIRRFDKHDVAKQEVDNLKFEEIC